MRHSVMPDNAIILCHVKSDTAGAGTRLQRRYDILYQRIVRLCWVHVWAHTVDDPVNFEGGYGLPDILYQRD